MERLRQETEQIIAERAVRMHTLVLNAITDAEAKLHSASQAGYVCACMYIYVYVCVCM